MESVAKFSASILVFLSWIKPMCGSPNKLAKTFWNSVPILRRYSIIKFKNVHSAVWMIFKSLIKGFFTYLFLWEQPETCKFFILTPRSAFWFRAGISTVESDSGVSFSPWDLTLGIHFHKELTPPCKWHRGVLSAPCCLISSMESYQLRRVLSAPWSLISSAVSYQLRGVLSAPRCNS